MKHDSPTVLEALDTAWDPERGYLGNLRDGRFVPELGDAYLELLQTIEIPERERLHPDFVRLLWFAPRFSEWQTQRTVDRGADRVELSKYSNLIWNAIIELLGAEVPPPSRRSPSTSPRPSAHRGRYCGSRSNSEVTDRTVVFRWGDHASVRTTPPASRGRGRSSRVRGFGHVTVFRVGRTMTKGINLKAFSTMCRTPHSERIDPWTPLPPPRTSSANCFASAGMCAGHTPDAHSSLTASTFQICRARTRRRPMRRWTDWRTWSGSSCAEASDDVVPGDATPRRLQARVARNSTHVWMVARRG